MSAPAAAALAPPALTVVFITPDTYATIQRTVRHVRAQTALAELEVLLFAPSLQALDADAGELAAFPRLRLLETGPAASVGSLRARSVREAAAPVVVFTEDHCFPDPEWAAALIARHREPWAAVGPVVRNANPETLVSWADMLIGYAPWMAPGVPGDATHLPGHNSSYKVAPLRAYGAELDDLMDAETILQWELRRHGHRLCVEPAAQVAHTNSAYWRMWVPIQLHQGRVFADTRRRGWSRGRRLAFTLGAPLIPLVRLVRTLRDAGRAGVPGRTLARAAPALAIGLVVDAAGQALGYSLGAGRSREAIWECEFHRNEVRPARPRAAAPPW